MRTIEYRHLCIKLFAITAISLAGLLASCSKKPASAGDREVDDAARKSRQELSERGEKNSTEPSEEAEEDETPDTGDIGEDCVAFLSATKTIPVKGAIGDCPACPTNTGRNEVLKFHNIKIDRISKSGVTCQVAVRIFATFNPSQGGIIGGGLVGWIPAEQRAEYSSGKTPSGEQVYKVDITYRRNANGWQPLDFTPSH